MEIHHHHQPGGIALTIIFTIVSFLLRFIASFKEFDDAIMLPLLHFTQWVAAACAIISFACVLHPPLKEIIVSKFKIKKDVEKD